LKKIGREIFYREKYIVESNSIKKFSRERNIIEREKDIYSREEPNKKIRGNIIERFNHIIERVTT